MTRERYHHGDLRGALLDGAEALVRERGADGWSLREATVRIGVSPSAAYHHFASRDALVRALSDRLVARLGERMSRAAARARGGPRHRLVAAARDYVRWAIEDPAVAGLIFAAHRAEPGEPVSPHPHDVFAAELDRLAAEGGLPASARPGAEIVVWSAMHGLATLLVDGLVRFDGPRAIDRQAERLIGAVLTGLEQEPEPSSPWPLSRTSHTERKARENVGGPA
ncbi:TetR/AcrR family transcriptional regulator [Amycolatopsis sp. NBC_00348]|uniref:TetR/AcrR family transcriptional regulator n=1 Tax=Amycolatopsis sp. NBC_00348 TaxID=2975956 RepID=UPI002E262232